MAASPTAIWQPIKETKENKVRIITQFRLTVILKSIIPLFGGCIRQWRFRWDFSHKAAFVMLDKL